MAPSGADKLRLVFLDAGIPASEFDQDEVDDALKELRKGLAAIGKPSAYEDKREWHRALLEVLHVAVPAVVEKFGEVLAVPDALGEKLETIFVAAKTVNIVTALESAPDWREVAEIYRMDYEDIEPAAPALPMVDGEWVVLEAGALHGHVAPLDVIANAAGEGRVKGDKGVVRFRGQDVFVGKKVEGQSPSLSAPAVAAPAPGTPAAAPLFSQLSAAAAAPQFGAPPSHSPPAVAPQPTYSPPTVQPGLGYPQGWGLFAGPIGLKPDHVPTAPGLLRLMSPAGGGGPNCGRAWVAQTYADLKGSTEYSHLETHATLLDARIGQLSGSTAEQILSDATVEIHSSEIVAMDFLLRTGDEVGAEEMRAMAGAGTFAASHAVRKHAYAATKSVAQNKEHMKTARGRGWGLKPRGRGKGGGKGGDFTGSGTGRGVKCHRCGEHGHPARLCPAAAPVLEQ